MSGISSSASITFNRQAPLRIEVHSFCSNTLSFFNDSDDALSYASLYISATPEQFRQISLKCLEFAKELESKIQDEQTEQAESKEAPAA